MNNFLYSVTLNLRLILDIFFALNLMKELIDFPLSLTLALKAHHQKIIKMIYSTSNSYQPKLFSVAEPYDIEAFIANKVDGFSDFQELILEEIEPLSVDRRQISTVFTFVISKFVSTLFSWVTKILAAIKLKNLASERIFNLPRT